MNEQLQDLRMNRYLGLATGSSNEQDLRMNRYLGLATGSSNEQLTAAVSSARQPSTCAGEKAWETLSGNKPTVIVTSTDLAKMTCWKQKNERRTTTDLIITTC
ncbi:hypothetical protein DPMN_111077 [Dreissena polymorpha]|uniref:Uncharacterized protein n=1 Tax=Dreissena polymorpha TaxID=45954 RepID=A0A9D4QNH2_DREPO|nr:hypothetical protein DPMN_111077 [Dreissena polymorpha]